MELDPTESINNMGTLRVDVLDAADLPSADRNGYSDPYCKFFLGDKDVFKTKVQKKTLHPAWNEFFETPIKSRIGANFHVDVYDWDFGDKADFLGASPIDLDTLEPFTAQEVTLPLNGKSGAIRLKLLFKPTYVMRSRQGSSTFSGTFAVPGKIVGAPVKGVGFVGGNVIKGASFLKRGVTRTFQKNNKGYAASVASNDEAPVESQPDAGVTPVAASVDGNSPSNSVPQTPQKDHNRNRSSASQLGDRLSIFGGTLGRGDTGSANITIVSVSGFPPSTNVRVVIRAQGAKGAKEVHKTKAHKTDDGSVQFNDSFRVHNTTADAQYQIRVVDHSTFGSDDVLGDAPFFVEDQGSAGHDKSVTVGDGTVILRSSFVPSENNALQPTTSHSTAGGDPSERVDSPDSRRLARRSFLSKRSVSGVGA